MEQLSQSSHFICIRNETRIYGYLLKAASTEWYNINCTTQSTQPFELSGLHEKSSFKYLINNLIPERIVPGRYVTHKRSSHTSLQLASQPYLFFLRVVSSLNT